ncbi:MAG: hypothetical protein ACC631_03620 [Halocynthiibacter sp.]
MKRIILATTIALGFAAPAFAETTDFARHHFAADDTGLESRVVDSTSTISQRGIDVFVSLANENTGNERALTILADDVSVSSKGGVNGNAQIIFAQLLAAEDASDK